VGKRLILPLIGSIIGNVVVSYIYDESKKRQAEEYSQQLARYLGKPILNAGYRLREVEGAIHCDINPLEEWVKYCDVQNLSQFGDRAFSVCLLSHVLEHVDDPIAALSEAERVADHVVLVLPKPWQLPNLLHPGHKWDIEDFGPGLIFKSRRDGRILVYRKPLNLTTNEEINIIESTLNYLSQIYQVQKPRYVLNGWCPSGAIACFLENGEMVFHHSRVSPNVVAHEFAHYLQYLRGDFWTRSKEELEGEAMEFEKRFLKGEIKI
jgi:SAM-dependent methyltransferase